MGFKARKARPAEAQAQIVDKGQLVLLVREERIGTDEREFNGVGRPTANVDLVIAGSCPAMTADSASTSSEHLQMD
jgi:hypothetical protein